MNNKTTPFVKFFGLNKKELATALRNAAKYSNNPSAFYSERRAFRRIAQLIEHGGDIR